jgi:pyridoxine/pyridoxamine 5'-phosphate oxidase
MTPDPIAEIVTARGEARRRKDAHVDVCFLATVGAQGRPEARPVSLGLLPPSGLVCSSAAA